MMLRLEERILVGAIFALAVAVAHASSGRVEAARRAAEAALRPVYVAPGNSVTMSGLTIRNDGSRAAWVSWEAASP